MKSGTRDVSWEVECLLSKHETLDSVLGDPETGYGKPSAREVEAGGSEVQCYP